MTRQPNSNIPSARIRLLIICGALLIGIWLLLQIFYNNNNSQTQQYQLEQQQQPQQNSKTLTYENTLIELKDALIKDRIASAESKYSLSVKVRNAVANKTPMRKGTELWHIPEYRVFWDYFYPAFDCPHLTERIGRLGDGGKWVCGFDQILTANSCIVYSFGVNQEFTFEQEILTRSSNCIVRMYDPTVSLKGDLAKFIKEFKPRSQFEHLGVGNENKGLIKTLGTIMRENNDDYIDILKIDIEGHEFDTLTQILTEFSSSSDGELPFGQLQLEIHLGSFNSKNKLKDFLVWWERLESAGLRLFHREANYLPAIMGKKNFVEFFEFAFINIQNHKNVLLHS